jgi:predicted anti-sigma-YlaC factor YlaD
VTCEDVRLAAMALGDGEAASLPREVIDAHVAECAACREEVERLAAHTRLWRSYSRQSYAADLWPAIETRLGRWRPQLAILVALLVAFRVLEIVPARTSGLWFPVLALISAAVVFVVLQQNPFTINTELRLDEEQS